jgi:3,4-dihydroxy 2-butanone 4-phosphate synthase/GTP cyclohydrolase II
MSDEHKLESNDVKAAADSFKQGGLVLIWDETRPEAGSVVVAAAERTNDDVVSFMANHARGIVGLALLPHRVDRLGLSLQGPEAEDGRENYTVSIEARSGVTTGISAADRARTIQVATSELSGPEDLVTPGHIFPIRSDVRGLVSRRGWAEAGIDLARIAGAQPAASVCHVLGADGEPLTGDEARAFAHTHGLAVVTVDDIVAHRMLHESFVALLTQATVTTAYGDFIARVFKDELTGDQHMALTLGEIRTKDSVLTRLHSECLTGDVFGSQRCDCGGQLNEAMRRIAKNGRGILLYLRQEGRGIGLANKILAYGLQDRGKDTVEANLALGLPVDLRDFGLGAQMLLALGVRNVTLLTNNPRKIEDLQRFGIAVTDREVLEIDPGQGTVNYLRTKKDKMGHLLTKV